MRVQVRQNMGYCPQFDAIHEQLIGRQTLTMYARLYKNAIFTQGPSRVIEASGIRQITWRETELGTETPNQISIRGKAGERARYAEPQ
ncbi:hypothetical protein BaRGS_00017460 [Batillaria attramentaria]|uniref:Uncharacterized protein n=1 Tax=Batillaria attramentaria TaxID=370345 RepID=A0ABD0KW70_9CAEN